MNTKQQLPGGYKVPDKKTYPKTRYLATDNPVEQVQLKASLLASPIGDWRDGKYYATTYSLDQVRGKKYVVKA